MTVDWNTKTSRNGTGSQEVVLDVKGLKVYYATPTGDVKAVDDVNFSDL